VLLPCRHLVACKECALNMVEFGAGGTIVQPESDPAPVPTPAPGSAAAPSEEPSATGAAEHPEHVGDTTATTTSAAAATPSVPATTLAPTVVPVRRKRRAKGWFCPVCRQPYSSLLRLTTTPPEILSKEAEVSRLAKPEEVAEPPVAARSGGLPGFFRSLSSRAPAVQDPERLSGNV